MKNIEILVQEHDIIIQVLQVFEEEALHIKKYHKINTEYISSMLDFFKNFADKFHHAKEENHLFEILIKNGMECKESPVEYMFMEHEQGRNYLKNIREFLDDDIQPETCEKLYKEMNAFINLLRNHIDKENNMIYVMAENFISPEEDIALTMIYETIEKGQIEIIEKYRLYAKEITVMNYPEAEPRGI